MRRLALGVEYAGNNYHGWQSQELRVNAVQSEVERALSKIANHEVSIVCAGRTDAGVHSCGQVVHCDVTVQRSEDAWLLGCNRFLPHDIRVIWAKEVNDDFDARRSAIARRYKYVVYNNKIRPSMLGDYVAWHYYPLDVDKMSQAAASLVGQHDFSSFRASGCQSKSPVRIIKSIKIERHNDIILIEVVGNAFLYHMVRNMAGVLLEIGDGRRPVSWAQDVLLAKDRKVAGITAPAQGLYLAGVEYPQAWQIPRDSASLWFLKQGENV